VGSAALGGGGRPLPGGPRGIAQSDRSAGSLSRIARPPGSALESAPTTLVLDQQQNLAAVATASCCWSRTGGGRIRTWPASTRSASNRASERLASKRQPGSSRAGRDGGLRFPCRLTNFWVEIRSERGEAVTSGAGHPRHEPGH